MKNLCTLVSAVTVFLMAGSAAFGSSLSDVLPASGDSLSIYKQVGEWTVHADASRGSCHT